MAGSQGPEHWMGEVVGITFSGDSDARHQKGLLEGINEAGVTLLMGSTVWPKDVTPVDEPSPQHVFYPWHRIMLIARDAEPNLEQGPES